MVPDFRTLAYTEPSASAPAAEDPWMTSEGIAIAPLTGAEAVADLPLGTIPGQPPYIRGPYPTMYVQKPWTIRQYAGFSTAEESNAFYRRNLAAGQKGLSVAFDLATHRGYDSRPPARDRRRRHGGRRDRLHPRHAHPVRRHPARRDDRLDDDERRGAAGAGALHRRGRRAGRAAGQARRDHPERHPEGVHGPQHLHLPAAPVDADHRRTSSPTPREHMPRFNSISISGYHMQEAGATADLELAYTLADGLEYIRTGVTRRARRRRVRAAAVVLLGHRHELLHGSRQDARRPLPVGDAGAAGVRAEEPDAPCRCAPTARPPAGR